MQALNSPPTTTDQDLDLPYHPAAAIFPLMEGAEFDELVADIERRKLRFSIVLFKGQIVDGRNRYRACRKAGAELHFVEFDGPEEDIPRFIISANIHRRHLNAKDRCRYLKQLIELNPEKSNLQLSKEAKTSEKTVKKARAEVEARSDSSERQTRTDTKGRKQPARKTRKANGIKPAGSTSAKPEPTIDLGKDEYSRVDGFDRDADISPVTAPAASLSESQTATRILFMHRVDLLLPLAIRGLQLDAEDAARVEALCNKLLEMITENSDAPASGTVAPHSAGANGSGTVREHGAGNIAEGEPQDVG
jgi:ParB-like chromosome segregation protein Spo0J